ncbi:Na+/H+ antiporter subunit E [Gammaproteobacteria bacterium]|nr:Na+/H+ antiporter subunit E [Gammaproteobacteria bacterium]
MKAASIFILCAVLWLLWSGLFMPLLLVFGLVSCLLVAWILHGLPSVDAADKPLRMMLRLPLYWLWLFWQMLLASITVARQVWSPRMPISPTLIEVRATQKTALGLTMHANSITLTPGTLSVEAEPGRILVHALTREGAADTAEGLIDRAATRLEGVDV